MTQFHGEYFLCGTKGTATATTKPLLDNCPVCDGLLSIHYKTDEEIIEYEQTKKEINYA